MSERDEPVREASPADNFRKMSATEFCASLAALGLGQHQFARFTGASRETVNRWAKGRYAIPPPIVLLVRLMLESKAWHNWIIYEAEFDAEPERVLAPGVTALRLPPPLPTPSIKKRNAGQRGAPEATQDVSIRSEPG